MSRRVRVWRADAAATAAMRPRLAEILVDCVHHGASVGFLAPLAETDADAYWLGVQRAVAGQRCLLLAAAVEDGPVEGTVQLDIGTPPNQPHRATVSKLLVHSGARRQGVGHALMTGAERAAVAAGRWLLTLDTATAAAERLYQRLGWSLAGTIPAYALNPDRTLSATAVYWKRLAPSGQASDEPSGQASDGASDGASGQASDGASGRAADASGRVGGQQGTPAARE